MNDLLYRVLTKLGRILLATGLLLMGFVAVIQAFHKLGLK